MITTQLYMGSTFAALRSANSIVSNVNTLNQTGLAPVSKAEPCRHCGKPDWCYRLDNLDVCKRGQVAQGWHTTSKVDKDGDAYLALITERTQKQTRPTQTRFWEYDLLDGSGKVRVKRVDFGDGRKKTFSQEHWDGAYWKKGLNGIEYSAIDIYRAQEIRDAIAQSRTIYIVEGETKADLFWFLGLAATCNIGGSGKPFNTARLEGATSIVICPDRDQVGIKWAVTIFNSLLHADNVKFLLAYPDSKLWGKLPKSGGLDVLDWVEDFNLTKEQIEQAVMDLDVFKQKLELNFHQPTVAEQGRGSLKPSKNRLKAKLIEKAWGSRLRFNELDRAIEMEGEKIDADTIIVDIALELDMDIEPGLAIAILQKLAKKDSYHPVKEYLERVHTQEHNHGFNLDELAARYLGTTNPLHAVYFKRHLIASVARIYEPGCKHDNALILQGEQGIQKTTFFRDLHGADFFSDTLNEEGGKDEILKMHRFWCTEWGELENVFSRRENSKVKAFLSSPVDAVRPPYGREVKNLKRMSVIVGSTNKTEFLTDETGDRRYWVINIPKGHTIDLFLVKSERDKIWAAAVEAYKNGEQWHLTPEERRQQDEANKDYRSTDTWETFIEKFIEGKTFTTAADILTNSDLAIEPGRHKKSDEQRVAKILRQNGWKPGKKRIEGKQIRGWLHETDSPEVELVSEFVSEFVSPSNPYQSSISQVVRQSDKPFPKKLFKKMDEVNSISTCNGETGNGSSLKSLSVGLTEAKNELQQGLEGETNSVPPENLAQSVNEVKTQSEPLFQGETNFSETDFSETNSEPTSQIHVLNEAKASQSQHTSQSQHNSVTVATDTGTLAKPVEEDDTALALSLTAQTLQDIAKHWAVEELNNLRMSMTSEQLNLAVKKLSPQLRKRIVDMVKNARQYRGENVLTGMVDGKLNSIEPRQYVFVTDEVHSSQINPECKQRLVYVKPVGFAWGNGIQVLESQLLEYKPSATC